MFLSMDVLIASILSLIFMWLSFSAMGNMLQSLYAVGVTATAKIDQSLNQLDSVMVDFGNKSAALSADVAQVGQNVADQGVIANLLPPDKETALSLKVNEVKQTVGQVKDGIDTVRSIMQLVRAIPFIQTPNLDDSVLGKLDKIVQDIEKFVGDVRQGIEDLRNGVAGAIERVSAALAQVSAAVFDARFPLAQLRAYVQAANQVLLPFLQVFTPIFFLFVGAIFSILYGWTAFVMWKFFQWARVWRKGASPTFAPVPVAATVTDAPVPLVVESQPEEKQ
jgi:methyl-accepting chemotaxis protein